MPLSKRKEAPLDPFKRALTLATRSIAADGTVEVDLLKRAAWALRQDRAAAWSLRACRPEARSR